MRLLAAVRATLARADGRRHLRHAGRHHAAWEMPIGVRVAGPRVVEHTSMECVMGMVRRHRAVEPVLRLLIASRGVRSATAHARRGRSDPSALPEPAIGHQALLGDGARVLGGRYQVGAAP